MPAKHFCIVSIFVVGPWATKIKQRENLYAENLPGQKLTHLQHIIQPIPTIKSAYQTSRAIMLLIRIRTVTTVI